MMARGEETIVSLVFAANPRSFDKLCPTVTVTFFSVFSEGREAG